MIRLSLAVALGGAIGSVARLGLGAYAQRFHFAFPWATLGINVAGSFLLGVLVSIPADSALPPEWRAALTVGFCGGFTTFSTFSYEGLRLLQAGETIRAALYVTSSVLLCMAAVFAGFIASRTLVAPAG